MIHYFLAILLLFPAMVKAISLLMFRPLTKRSQPLTQNIFNIEHSYNRMILSIVLITSLHASSGYGMDMDTMLDELAGSRGASPTSQGDINPREVSPLLDVETEDVILAAESNDLIEISALLAAGRDVNSRGRLGQTALHDAVSYNKPELVRLLLAHGADTTIQDNCGYTPLHRAVAEDYGGQVRNPTIVRLLLDHGADLTVNVKNFSMCETPLHKAAFHSNPIIIDMLLAAGANPNIQNADFDTPLHITLSYGDHDERTVHLLLEAHADPNSAGNNGITPLHIAAMNGNLEIFRMLVKAGGDIHKPDSNGHTPLHYTKSHEITSELLDLGAEIDQQDYQGKTAMHLFTLAERLDRGVGCIDKALVLFARGADLKIKDHFLYTALDCYRPCIITIVIKACLRIQTEKEQSLASTLALATHARLGTQSPLCLLPAYLLANIIHQVKLNEARSNTICKADLADIMKTIWPCLSFQNLKEQASAYRLASATHDRLVSRSPLHSLPLYVLTETTRFYNKAGYKFPLPQGNPVLFTLSNAHCTLL